MKCWNCGYEVQPNTQVCRRCEADQREHKEADPTVLNETISVVESQAPGLLESLRELAERHGTAEDFVNAIFLGPCPECESEKVGDCEHDPDYEDLHLGRCFSCGNVWCSECGYILKKGERKCPDRDKHDDDLLKLSESQDFQ